MLILFPHWPPKSKWIRSWESAAHARIFSFEMSCAHSGREFRFWFSSLFCLGGLDVESTRWRIRLLITFSSCRSFFTRGREVQRWLLPSSTPLATDDGNHLSLSLVPLHYLKWDVWKINHLLLSDRMTTIQGAAGRCITESERGKNRNEY